MLSTTATTATTATAAKQRTLFVLARRKNVFLNTAPKNGNKFQTKAKPPKLTTDVEEVDFEDALKSSLKANDSGDSLETNSDVTSDRFDSVDRDHQKLVDEGRLRVDDRVGLVPIGTSSSTDVTNGEERDLERVDRVNERKSRRTIKSSKSTKSTVSISHSVKERVANADPTLIAAGVGAVGMIAYFLWTKMQKRQLLKRNDGEEVFDMNAKSGGVDGNGKQEKILKQQKNREASTTTSSSSSDSDFYKSLNKAAKENVGIDGTGENAPVGAGNLPPGLRMFTTTDEVSSDDESASMSKSSSSKENLDSGAKKQQQQQKKTTTTKTTDDERVQTFMPRLCGRT